MRNALTPGQASRPIRHQASHRLRDRHRRLRQHGPRPPQDHDQRKAPSHARHQLGLLCLVFVLVNHTAVEHGLQISHGFERVGWDRSSGVCGMAPGSTTPGSTAMGTAVEAVGTTAGTTVGTAAEAAGTAAKAVGYTTVGTSSGGGGRNSPRCATLCHGLAHLTCSGSGAA